MTQQSSATTVPETPASTEGGRSSSFPLVRVLALTYLVFVFARVDVADPDLWWHLRNAQFVLTTHHLPVVDSYSYTAAGTPVIPFEWLSEIPYYLAYKAAGLPGVFVLVFLLCTAIVLGVFRLSMLASRDSISPFLATAAGSILMKVSIGGRTLLFGWLYLVVLLLTLEKARRGGTRSLWLLPPLFCLWINSHGSWPMGFVVFGIYIAAGLIEGTWGRVYAVRWTGPQLRSLFLVGATSFLALFLNPFGYRLVAFPFRVFFASGASGPVMIQEFASIDFHTPLGKAAMLLILGTLLIAILSPERWRLDELGFMMLALYFGLTNVRFMFLAGILAPPIFAKRLNFSALGMRRQPHETAAPSTPTSDVPGTPARVAPKHGSNRWLANAVVLLIFGYVFFASAPRDRKFQSPLIDYPEGAVAYMKQNGIRGRLFHDWDWGGYLIWHAPEMKVFIDGRGEPYGANGVFGDYWNTISNRDPQAVLDKYRVEYVLMPPQSALARALRESPNWTAIYSDKASILFHRTTALSSTGASTFDSTRSS